MTQIHISIRKPKTGGLAPVTGVMRFRPVRRHFDAAKNLVIAASFDAYLSETGELTVDLLPTTGAFVWQVVELADTPQAYTRYVEVPDSRTKVEYADLVEVDAATFVPKALTGSTLLQVMHAASQAEAETLSAANPGKLIIFDETASTAKAAAVLASLESIASEASTNASVAAASLASVQHAALNATLLNTQIEDAAHKAKSSASNAQSSSAAANTPEVIVIYGFYINDLQNDLTATEPATDLSKIAATYKSKFDELKAKYPQARIFYALQCSFRSAATEAKPRMTGLPAGTIMTNSFTALQSSERILFTEETLGVPVIDATDEVWALGSGLTISDMIHPTAEGAVKLGQILGRHIKQALQEG